MGLKVFLVKHQGMKIYAGVEVQIYVLASALDGGERSVSRYGRFTLGTRQLSNNSTGGWVGPRSQS
jgi:hypothetical protein